VIAAKGRHGEEVRVNKDDEVRDGLLTSCVRDRVLDGGFKLRDDSTIDR
jgi:hypothetical protein